MSTQKKRKCLTIEQRAKIVEKLRSGITLTQLATDYNVTVAAISHIKKNQEIILRQKRILEECGSSTKRRRYTGIEVSPREQSLYTWLTQKRNVGDPVKGSTVVEKALLFNEVFEGAEGFKASAGFLYKFKKRHCIRALSIQGEKMSVNSATSKAFCQQFSQFCQSNGYNSDQVYNADETGLFSKLLPVHRGKSNKSAKSTDSEDRISMMFCANADGSHKITPLLIGKSENPRCFNNIECLPVEYRHQKDGFVTKDLVLDWFRNVFLPAVQQKHGSIGKKVILLLDNAPIHPDPQEFDSISDICIVIPIPSSITSLIQPMSRGIIERIKKTYKQNLLRFLLGIESNEEVAETHKTINILQVCNFVSYSWSELTQEQIRLGWKRIFPLGTDLPSQGQLSGRDVIKMVQVLPGCKKVTEKEANAWLNADANDLGWQILAEEEVIERTDEVNDYRNAEEKVGEFDRIVIKEEPILEEVQVKEEMIEENGEREEENEVEPEEEERDDVNDEGDQEFQTENPPCDHEILKALNTVMGWYQTTSECCTKDIIFFEGLRTKLTTSLSADRRASRRKNSSSSCTGDKN